jgi:hypothetical protein
MEELFSRARTAKLSINELRAIEQFADDAISALMAQIRFLKKELVVAEGTTLLLEEKLLEQGTTQDELDDIYVSARESKGAVA